MTIEMEEYGQIDFNSLENLLNKSIFHVSNLRQINLSEVERNAEYWELLAVLDEIDCLVTPLKEEESEQE
jgi:hypothetical protein